MSLTVEEKAELAAKFGKTATDTGSPEVQIAIFDMRIKRLQAHLNDHKHDQSSRRGLLKLVGKGRSFLVYLKNNNPESYRNILQELALRR